MDSWFWRDENISTRPAAGLIPILCCRQFDLAMLAPAALHDSKRLPTMHKSGFKRLRYYVDELDVIR